MSRRHTHIDCIIVLHLERRTDRLRHINAELEVIGGASNTNVLWFDGYDKPAGNGNRGCSESHRGILELIAFNKFENALVLEDDATVRPAFRDDFRRQFRDLVSDVPEDAKIVYLGGGYADAPKRRVSPHVIEVNRMLTTSSFLIGWKMAREMAPYISGVGPIDNLFGEFTARGQCYCISPRMFVQYTSMSDLSDREVDYEPSMTDTRHEEMLLGDGLLEPSQDGLLSYKSTINRREIAAPNDMNGEEVIIGTDHYTVAGLRLPSHLAPWYRGEQCTYILAPK